MHPHLRAAWLGMVLACSACESMEAEQAPAEAPPPTGDVRPYVGAAPPPEDHGAPSAMYPAPHDGAPEVRSLGGPILARPRVVPIAFAGDAYAAEISAFLRAMAKSSYWGAATAEYGVGELEISDAMMVLDVPASAIDEASTEEWIAAALDAKGSALPAPDDRTVYAIFYPRGTLLSGARWGKGCVDFAGYHWEATREDGSRVPYIVIPRCPSWRDLHGFDVVTTAASHEIVEAVTDPFPSSGPAFAAVDPDHQVWQLFPYGELADMCSEEADAQFRPADLDYVVQRTWSNAEARAHHDPCGARGKAYFNSAPRLDDDVSIEMVTRSAMTKGVRIPLGESRTIEIDLFSDAPTQGAWTVTARDVSSLGGRLPSLSFALDREEGVNGEKLHLTITAVREGQSGGAEFMLVSTLGSQTSAWFGFVAN